MKKGFTLIELIVVIAILGVLVLLATPKFLGYTEKARLTQIKNDVAAHERQLGVELTKDPTYLELGDYSEFLCNTNAEDYLENIKNNTNVTKEDIAELPLFDSYPDYTREEMIEYVLENIEQGYYTFYNERGLVNSEKEVAKMVDEGNMYHVIAKSEVKSKLPGSFLASPTGEVIYVESLLEVWPSCYE